MTEKKRTKSTGQKTRSREGSSTGTGTAPESATRRPAWKKSSSAPKRASRTAKKPEPREEVPSDDGLIIVDEAPLIDRERINEERRAYLEEARSQEAFD